MIEDETMKLLVERFGGINKPERRRCSRDKNMSYGGEWGMVERYMDGDNEKPQNYCRFYLCNFKQNLLLKVTAGVNWTTYSRTFETNQG